MTHSFAAGVVTLNNDVVQKWEENLPQDGLPCLRLQYGPVRRNGREQGLTGTLSNGGPRVEAEVLELAVQTHPQLVEGGNVFAARKREESFRKYLLVARVFLLLKIESQKFEAMKYEDLYFSLTWNLKLIFTFMELTQIWQVEKLRTVRLRILDPSKL